VSAHPEFFAGFLTAGYLVAALFFLKYWRRIGDGLFLAFAAAFALMAVHAGLPTLLGVASDARSGFFLIRLAAFLLIIGAMLRKNLPRRS
jgi:hypothetical protein